MQDVIGYYGDLKKTLPRQVWAKEWLDQPLDIRPSREGIAAVIEVATKAREANRRRKQAQGKRPQPAGSGAVDA